MYVELRMDQGFHRQVMMTLVTVADLARMVFRNFILMALANKTDEIRVFWRGCVLTVMSPLRVPNFSPIRAHIRVLWRILQSVRNEEEKNEEIKTKFCSLVSTEMAGAIFFKFGM